jgi:signal peptidase
MHALRFIWLWLQVSGACIAAVAVLWLGAQALFHVRLLSVQTGSMRPTFASGDALVMRAGGRQALRIGAIVSYHSSRNPNELVTHRVVAVSSGADSFQTKGDALNTADPTVRSSLLAGRVVTILPGVGRLLNWLRSWPGLVSCVYIPVAALGAQELYRLEQNLSRPRLYRLHAKQVV